MRGGNRDLKDAGGDDPKLPPGSDDAFALWREHYRYYASPAMVERLKANRVLLYTNVFEGSELRSALAGPRSL